MSDVTKILPLLSVFALITFLLKKNIIGLSVLIYLGCNEGKVKFLQVL